MNSSIILKLVSAFVALFLIILLSSNLLSGVRLDLSEGGLYSLSDGTESILENLESDVTIDYYFSEQATSQLPALRTYAKRVEELLTEYESKSNGKLSINKIDPAPFSEQEDEAALAGLQSVPGGARGDEIYFGLVAKNAAGREEVVPFIQPDKEAFLEYDLTRLISALSRETLPKIGIYSGADIRGGFDVMSRQQTPEWAALQFINDNFDLEWIEDDAEAIEDVDMLLLIAPQDLSQRLQLAIDQYALSGGKVMVFVDPYIETMAMMNGMATVQSSNISALFESWGVAFDESQFITDFENSMVVSLGQGGQPARHLGLLSLGPNALSQDDVVLFGLESINLSSVGAMSAAEGASTVFTPVIQSSAQSALADVNVLTTLNDPSTLMNDFVPTEQRYTIAARVGGSAESAFPDGITVSEELADGEGSVDLKLEPSVLSSENINIMIVADSDVLSDRLWVQVQNFFGQQIISPWADNGSLLLNSVENLSGQSELISIRGQGRYSRPFERVEALQRDAEERFLAQQEALEAQLIATEEQMFELEQMRDGGDVVSLTEEQNKALLRFQEEKLKIRKQLRDVQHQLDQDIDALGTKLKLINIFLVPVLICFFALMLGFRQRRIANA
ncbi:hypothetical protein A3715_02335 [Oleiphilus sp. HI0009]|nr:MULTISPECIES: Gldg family protein [unclassified Oleiphilus]KZX75094.1 hypothetical protein A3715_02335 [Oleiphilus sp. HI0009]KZY70066.1 hypothetical protein A3739_07265 [Oleiphilus sp. HI0067]KZY71740.1 hypothetical protein A3738_03530 [Oleiphilus sp. HI0066]